MKILHQSNVNAYGTVRTNQKDLHTIMRWKVNLKRREFQLKSKEDIVAIKWMDNNITILSTINKSSTTTIVPRKNKDGIITQVSCTTAITTYSEIMGIGVAHTISHLRWSIWNWMMFLKVTVSNHAFLNWSGNCQWLLSLESK